MAYVEKNIPLAQPPVALGEIEFIDSPFIVSLLPTLSAPAKVTLPVTPNVLLKVAAPATLIPVLLTPRTSVPAPVVALPYLNDAINGLLVEEF